MSGVDAARKLRDDRADGRRLVERQSQIRGGGRSSEQTRVDVCDLANAVYPIGVERRPRRTLRFRAARELARLEEVGDQRGERYARLQRFRMRFAPRVVRLASQKSDVELPDDFSCGQ